MSKHEELTKSLRASAAAMPFDAAAAVQYRAAAAALEAQAREIERLRQDAARYRWLRQHDGVDCTDDGEFIAGALSGITIGIDASRAQGIDGADLDAAIDAARAAQEGSSHGLKT